MVQETTTPFIIALTTAPTCRACLCLARPMEGDEAGRVSADPETGKSFLPLMAVLGNAGLATRLPSSEALIVLNVV